MSTDNELPVAFTIDEAWDLLRKLADAQNSSDLPAAKALAYENLSKLTPDHFEVLLSCIELTAAGLAAERDFMQALHNEMERRNIRFEGSFRPAIRWALMEQMIAEQPAASH